MISKLIKYMEIYKHNKSKNIQFYSNDMFVSKRNLTQNQLKLTYQKQLISNLDEKHKDWSRNIGFE